jgi:hypothetical protein
MSRICFIGNSHLAAVKLGWDAVQRDYPGIEADFFGAPTRQFENIAVEDGLLVAKAAEAERFLRSTSGGRASAALLDYDVVVLVAMGFSFAIALDVYASYRADDQKNSDGEFELVSPAYFDEIAKARFAHASAVTYLKKIRKALQGRDTKIWLYPEPMPCISVLTSDVVPASKLETLRIASLKQAVAWHDEEALLRAFAAMRADLAQRGHAIFEQPAETRISTIFSRPEYARGSVRLTKNLNRAHPEDDYMHMNANYGAIVVRQILSRVASGPV